MTYEVIIVLKGGICTKMETEFQTPDAAERWARDASELESVMHALVREVNAVIRRAFKDGGPMP